MKKLRMTFLDGEGKRRNLEPRIAAENLSATVVRDSMSLLRDLEIFEKDDVPLYDVVKEAKYIETIETPLFKVD
ncbi:DUF2922 domain-containing protein [Enterococcus asini]|uniref:DUF2922 domain-containing protein n=1 Tax=Enterococcus TaxID=1350 RepID=UPI002892575A|nr:DUF2922 domain-containing protein [Enterococcus asini]MDT2757686.1 DUF2922 domain-containing protein [Enterococcus asini]